MQNLFRTFADPGCDPVRRHHHGAAVGLHLGLDLRRFPLLVLPVHDQVCSAFGPCRCCLPYRLRCTGSAACFRGLPTVCSPTAGVDTAGVDTAAAFRRTKRAGLVFSQVDEKANLANAAALALQEQGPGLRGGDAKHWMQSTGCKGGIAWCSLEASFQHLGDGRVPRHMNVLCSRKHFIHMAHLAPRLFHHNTPSAPPREGRHTTG